MVKSIPKSLFRSSTAVVQLTVNQLVVGSIPTLGAKFKHSNLVRTRYRVFKYGAV